MPIFEKMIPLGQYIAKIRREKGLSQPELADKAGIHSRQTIGAIEQAFQREPTINNLRKIAIALDINPEILYKLAGQPTNPNTGMDNILVKLEDILNSVQLLQRQLPNTFFANSSPAFAARLLSLILRYRGITAGNKPKAYR